MKQAYRFNADEKFHDEHGCLKNYDVMMYRDIWGKGGLELRKTSKTECLQ